MQNFNCPLNRAFCDGCEYFKTSGCNFPYNTFYSYSLNNIMDDNNMITVSVPKDKIIDFNGNVDNDTNTILIKVPKGKNIKWINNTLTLVNEDIPITERIKTFGDACRELGETHPYVVAYKGIHTPISWFDENNAAYFRLRIICTALNEGWVPKFTQEEKRWYPVFHLLSEKTISKMDEEHKKQMINVKEYQTEYKGFVWSCSNCNCHINPFLFLKTCELADYCGQQFIWIWANYLLIKKK